MHVVHGAWIPDDTAAFVQGGAFYLWVEADQTPFTARRRETQLSDVTNGTAHPEHLAGMELASFLVEHLGVVGIAPAALARALCPRYVLLPSTGGVPLPSPELARALPDEPPDALPPEAMLSPWQVCCYPVPDLIKTLNDMDFLLRDADDDCQPGADFRFWHQYTQAFKGIIVREGYIPSLKYQALPIPKGKRRKNAPALALYPGWELLPDPYETTLAQYLAAMPPVCAAGMQSMEQVAPFAPEPLLRHFSECLLHAVVMGTPFTAQFEGQITGSLLHDCLYPFQAMTPPAATQTWEDYTHWLGWRDRLTRAHTDAGFTLCFRLEEPSPDTDDNDNADGWQLQFLVAARHDPSLKMDLATYWRLTPPARADAARRFGGDGANGTGFERRLLLALGTAARIYPTVWEGLRTLHPTGCRLTLDEAFAFLKERAWVLDDAGYTVLVPAWWTPEGRRRVKIRLTTASRAAAATGNGTSRAASAGLGMDTLIAYDYQIAIGGEAVTEAEWAQLVAAKTPLVRFRGQWMELDGERMRQMLDFWQTRHDAAPEMALADLLKVGTEADDDLEWDHDATLREMLAALRDPGALAPVAEPPALRATLREYQKRGVAWLGFLERLGLNPCLADDMGLGKTLEVIAHLLVEQANAANAGDAADADVALAPTLVIAPTSVIGNWHREITRFAPELRVLVHGGGAREKDARAFGTACAAHDVVLTSFALARLDEKLLRGRTWARIVVDEAQNIKNPQAAQTRAIARLAAPHRIALTGTPVENRLRDLWSIFNFLNPGYLGKETQFRKNFEVPIDKYHDSLQAAVLKRLVEPFILRRVKTDRRIIDDLPDKIEQKTYCTLTPEQASLYAAVVEDVTEQLDSATGIGRKGLILSTLLRLKQVCNHPAQFLADGSAFTPERSHKLQRLDAMVEEAIGSGESLLIFTQFTEIGAALTRHFAHTRHFPTYYLHGGTSAPRRDAMVAAFQQPDTDAAVFILSLRAGGVGLNLTRANHVFHFDRWWNPAVENQATDRAFRIGQRKNVFVHTFTALGTLEERIDAMIEDKKRLSSLVVGSDEAWLTELDNDSFRDLIALRRDAVME